MRYQPDKPWTLHTIQRYSLFIYLFIYLSNSFIFIKWTKTRTFYLCKVTHSFVVFQVIRRDLINAIRKKWPQLYADVDNIISHQDNAHSHTAHQMQFEIDLIGFRKIVHPPYSPDLAPLDFAFFPLLKCCLRGKRFAAAAELNQATINIIWKLPHTWFQDVFDKWCST